MQEKKRKDDKSAKKERREADREWQVAQQVMQVRRLSMSHVVCAMCH